MTRLNSMLLSLENFQEIKMIVTSIHDYERIKKMRTKHLVRIFFDRKNTAVFYLSDKQYLNLVNAFEICFSSKKKGSYVIAVFDNIEERYVWCGIESNDYTDRDFLIKNFAAEWSNDYSIEETVTIEKHIPETINPVISNPDNKLKR